MQGQGREEEQGAGTAALAVSMSPLKLLLLLPLLFLALAQRAEFVVYVIAPTGHCSSGRSWLLGGNPPVVLAS